MALVGLRTIRGQLIAILLLFEVVALAFFSAVLLHELNIESQQRMMRRLEYQASELEVVSALALRNNDMEMLHTVVGSMLQFPTIASVKVTRLDGRVLAATDARLNGTVGLDTWERQRLEDAHALHLFQRPGAVHEAVMPVLVHGERVALIWIYPNDNRARTDLRELVRVSIWGVLAVLAACTLLAALIARSLSLPLVRLLAATRTIIENPADTSAFPMRVTSANEVADLTIACNLMVASIEEQRTGLSDTLSLLDSMLAHAPVGLAFFDRTGRFVRVNPYLEQNAATGVTRYLGRHVDEVFAPEAAAALKETITQVFEGGAPVQGLEVVGLGRQSSNPSDEKISPHTWLVNAYPVRTAGQVMRWAGVVLVDITERLRSERALRETEKLAVTGRLSASIAHEINNPLEAVTNLLYLLEHHGNLDAEAKLWARSAGHEVARVSEITQQTLRFYRQSSRPELCSLAELLDAVLTLHQGRIATLQVELHREYRDAGELFGLGGELRQLFANLIGNALDAMMPGGGRLTVAVRSGKGWDEADARGVRVTVADTGCGMSETVRARIFEPFYTTKEATGTGLGLWVSAEIMAKHHVSMRIRSRERKNGRPGGTVFLLFFPEVELAEPGILAAVEAQSV